MYPLIFGLVALPVSSFDDLVDPNKVANVNMLRSFMRAGSHICLQRPKNLRQSLWVTNVDFFDPSELRPLYPR